jgi:hypothetical protein
MSLGGNRWQSETLPGGLETRPTIERNCRIGDAPWSLRDGRVSAFAVRHRRTEWGRVSAGALRQGCGEPAKKKGLLLCKPLSLLVPRAGIEPAWCCHRQILSPAESTSYNNRQQEKQPLRLALLLPFSVDNCRFLPVSAPGVRHGDAGYPQAIGPKKPARGGARVGRAGGPRIAPKTEALCALVGVVLQILVRAVGNHKLDNRPRVVRAILEDDPVKHVGAVAEDEVAH